METITELKEFKENPHYHAQRQKCLCNLSDADIDQPIITLINGLNQLPYCFTLQCCYGHFVYNGQNDPHNLDPLPATDAPDAVEYRIAYIAMCIENSSLGMELFNRLKQITGIDPQYIQFCCAEWFWQRQVNSYALQVEPDRFKHQDTAVIDYAEALHIEKVRNAFFDRLSGVLQELVD